MKRQNRKKYTRWHEAIVLDHDRLLAIPNVQQVGVGLKEVASRMTRRYCVKVYVDGKKKRIREADRVPAHAYVLVPIGKGLYKKRRLPTDVVYFAPMSLCGPRDFLNPVGGGAQMGKAGSAPGTFTCMVSDQQGSLYGLTAGHVVRTSPGTIPKSAKIPLVQPMILPPGSPPGTAILFGRTLGGGYGDMKDGYYDFCVFEIRNGRGGTSSPLDGRMIVPEVLPPEIVINRKVNATKFGAVTLRTLGIFSRPVQTDTINGMTVRNVYEFKGTGPALFGEPGDSGSLVVCEGGEFHGGVIGILFATSPATPDAPGGRAWVVPFGRLPDSLSFAG